MKDNSTVKASISMDKEHLEMYKEFAKSRGMTFSGFVSFSCSNMMGQLKSYDIINDVADIMSRVKSGGSLSEDDMKVLESFEALRNLTK